MCVRLGGIYKYLLNGKSILMFTVPYFPLELDDNEPTSLMVSVWDIIWILTCDWLVGRLSVEQDLISRRELFSSV